MKYIILLLLISALGASLPLQAQNLPYLGLVAYPNISGARIAAGSFLNNAQIDSLERRETTRTSRSAGLVVQWQAEKVGFRSGILYTESGYASVREPVPGGSNSPEGASTQRLQYKSVLLEIPAELLFVHQPDNKNRVNFSMGLSAAINVRNIEQTDYYSGEKISSRQVTLDNHDFTPIHLSFVTGMGWQHEISPKFAFFAQPTFQFWFNGLLREAIDLNRNLYSVGLKTGILFNPNNN
jgi:hypothetical protein